MTTSPVTGVEVSAQRFVVRSQRPSFIADWARAATELWGAKKESRSAYRFADGSAVTFSGGLPVEFIG